MIRSVFMNGASAFVSAIGESLTVRQVVKGILLAAAGSMLTAQVRAQTAPATTRAESDASSTSQAESETSSGELGEIIVTGTHISEPGFTSPTPVSSLSAADIKIAADVSVYDLESDIPALVPNSLTQQASVVTGASNFNLRGLGAIRTLTLIDGLRVAPTSYDGTVDVNMLPVSIIQRVDVVTGGASAVYGSDAVGGVVNVILDNSFEGTKFNAQYGESQYGDEQQQDYSGAWGTGFADGRGHIVVAGEAYANSGGDDGQKLRPWTNTNSNSGPAIITNSAYTANGANGPKQIAAYGGTTFVNMTAGGVIDSGPLRGISFGPGGIVEPMVYGPYATSSTFMLGGTGGSFSQFAGVGPALRHDDAYTHISFDVTPNVTAWGEVLFADTRGESSVTPNYDNGTLTISANNYYLPSSVKTLAAADGVTSFTYGRENLELGINDPVSTYDDLRVLGGFRGKLSALGSEWTWDATYQFNQNNYFDLVYDNRNNTNWLNAINVVANPANGLPVCASTLKNPNNGCVPIDVFGTNAISAAGAAYVEGTSWNYYHQQMWDTTENLQGTPFNDWAGPVGVAVGFESRRDFIQGSADGGSLEKVWRVNNTQPFSGVQSVNEGYLETDVPLLKGLPFVKSLSLNAAGRITDYTLSGRADTWKVGLDYALDDSVRFRATRSRDIRAPTLNDLFEGVGSNVNQIIDRETNTSYTITDGTGGNPKLTPEIGEAYTMGVVLTPTVVNGLEVSFDYYHILLNNAITSPGIQGIEDDCELYGQKNLCQYVTRSPVTGLITFVQNTEFNAASLLTDGFDVNAAYRFRLDALAPSLGGNLTFRLDTTYIYTLATTNVGVTTDAAGGDIPHFHGDFRITYSSPDSRYIASVFWRYTGVTRYNTLYNDGVDINRNEAGGRTYTNLDLSYQVHKSVQVYGKVNNLFNIAPPLYTQSDIQPDYNTNNSYYDIIGRTYAVGVRMQF
jgi:iron complex outermembrane recepter protein